MPRNCARTMLLTKIAEMIIFFQEFVEQDHQVAQAEEGAGGHHEGEHAVAAEEVPSEDGAAAEDLAHRTEHRQRAGEAEADADAVQGGIPHAVLGGEGLRAAEDDAVHHDERDEQAEGLVHGRGVGLHQELDQRHEGGDDHDVGRDVDLVRDEPGDGGDDDVRQDQHEQGRKAHREAVDGGSRRRQRRAHAEDQDEGRVVLDQSVGNQFQLVTHCLVLLLRFAGDWRRRPRRRLRRRRPLPPRLRPGRRHGYRRGK